MSETFDIRSYLDYVCFIFFISDFYF